MLKRVSFFLYCAVIIIGLAVALVLLNKEPNVLQSKSATVGSENKQISNKTIYATSFVLNCPREIIIEKDEQVELLTNFYSVEPISMEEQVTTEITRKAGDVSAMSLTGNKIVATDTGFYYIKFSVPKSSKAYFKETLVVNVVDEKEADVTQLKKDITIGDSVAVSDIFTFNTENLNYEITTDDKLEYNNGIFTSKQQGSTKLSIAVSSMYVKYTYKFEINIKPVPSYEINIINFNSNIIELEFKKNKKYHIQYEITNQGQEYVPQKITTVVVDENILTATTNSDVFITIKCLSVGETSLTIICNADKNITKELIIILK